jgi:hypothetical protein
VPAPLVTLPAIVYLWMSGAHGTVRSDEPDAGCGCLIRFEPLPF